MTSNIFQQVADFAHSHLLKNDKALEYLTVERKLTESIISKFQLGLFPKDMRDMVKVLDPVELREAGIIRNVSSSKFRFWNLIIPIRDVYGEHIAIAGRTSLPEEKRQGKEKYMNTVYRKRQHLFGLNFARQTILRTQTAYVVEGYFDVISAHQSGIRNVVASCGKFLSKRQIALLTRYAKKIVLMLDNEKEAQLVANKIVERNRLKNTIINVLNPLPNNINDLDQFLRDHPASDLKLNIIEGYGNIEPYWT